MKKIWSVIIILSTILGIPAAIFGMYSYFNPDKAEPRYLLISDELTVSSPTSKIKIFYDSTEVQNIRIMQIALWNGGGTYVERHKILTPYLAKLSNKGVRILQVDISKKSRKELIFETKISDSKEEVMLYLLNNEVLEINDGIIFKIFYTSKRANEFWDIYTRMIGLPKGFENFEESFDNMKSNPLFFNIKMRFFEILLNSLFTVFCICVSFF